MKSRASKTLAVAQCSNSGPSKKQRSKGRSSQGREYGQEEKMGCVVDRSKLSGSVDCWRTTTNVMMKDQNLLVISSELDPRGLRMGN